MPNLDPIILTKAEKVVSKHRDNQICVTVEAVGIFPGGRKPHELYFSSGPRNTYMIDPAHGYIKNRVQLPKSQVEAWFKSLPVVNSITSPVPDAWWPTTEKLAREVNKEIAILDMPSPPKLKPAFHRKAEPAKEPREAVTAYPLGIMADIRKSAMYQVCMKKSIPELEKAVEYWTRQQSADLTGFGEVTKRAVRADSEFKLSAVKLALQDKSKKAKPTTAPSKDLYWYTVPGLREMCSKRGLPATGDEKELIRRLNGYG